MNEILKNKIIIILIVIILFFLIWGLNLYYNIRHAKIVYSVKIFIDGLDVTSLESIKMFREAPKSGISEINLIYNKNTQILNWEVRNYYIKKIFIIIPYTILNKKYSLNINIGDKLFIFKNDEILNFKKYKNKKMTEYEKKNEIFEIPENVRSKGFNFYLLSDIINIKKIFEILFISFFESLFFSLIIIFLFYLGFDRSFFYK